MRRNWEGVKDHGPSSTFCEKELERSEEPNPGRFLYVSGKLLHGLSPPLSDNFSKTTGYHKAFEELFFHSPNTLNSLFVR